MEDRDLEQRQHPARESSSWARDIDCTSRSRLSGRERSSCEIFGMLTPRSRTGPRSDESPREFAACLTKGREPWQNPRSARAMPLPT